MQNSEEPSPVKTCINYKSLVKANRIQQDVGKNSVNTIVA